MCTRSHTAYQLDPLGTASYIVYRIYGLVKSQTCKDTTCINMYRVGRYYTHLPVFLVLPLKCIYQASKYLYTRTTSTYVRRDLHTCQVVDILFAFLVLQQPISTTIWYCRSRSYDYVRQLAIARCCYIYLQVRIRYTLLLNYSIYFIFIHWLFRVRHVGLC